jgi:hypothetical protein
LPDAELREEGIEMIAPHARTEEAQDQGRAQAQALQEAPEGEAAD